MSSTENGGAEEKNDGHGSRTPVAKYVKSIPLIRPGRLHRAKIRVYTRFPALAAGAEKRATARLAKSAEWHQESAFPFKMVVYVTIAIALVMGLLSGLVLLSRGSRPGSPLYSVMRLQERVAVTLTRDPVGKAVKKLSLAGKCLDNIIYMAANQERYGAEDMMSVAREYRAYVEDSKRIIEEQLSNGNSEGAGKAAAGCEELQDREITVLHQLVASGCESVLVPAVGARVTVFDNNDETEKSERILVADGSADGEGKFAFFPGASAVRNREDLEVSIGLDGRIASYPLFPKTGSRGFESDRTSTKSAPEQGEPVPRPRPLTGSTGSDGYLVRVLGPKPEGGSFKLRVTLKIFKMYETVFMYCD